MSLDELELELRKLPGVHAVGFGVHDDVLVVQVDVGEHEEPVDPGLARQASRIAGRHSQRPVAVELVRWQTPAGDEATAPETTPDAVQPVPDAGEAEQARAAQPARRTRAQMVSRVLYGAALALFFVFVVSALAAIRYVRNEFGGEADVYRYAAALAEISPPLVAAVVAWVGSAIIRATRAVQAAPPGSPEAPSAPAPSRG